MPQKAGAAAIASSATPHPQDLQTFPLPAPILLADPQHLHEPQAAVGGGGGPLDAQGLHVGNVGSEEGHLPGHQQTVEADLVALAVGGLRVGDAHQALLAAVVHLRRSSRCVFPRSIPWVGG